MIFNNQISKLFFSFLLIGNVSYAENLLYTDLQKMCEFNEDLNPENKEQVNTKELSCFYYIKGYLEVANHNCMFGLNSNNLHKLNTKKINFEQILKSLDIYDQKFSTISSGNAIDHLWNVFNKHWPCNN
jgi:hypothetical protein